MDSNTDSLTCGYGADERALLALRGLFENRGFKKINVNKFEEYNLYMDNSSFLESDNIISFMDINGKLMALKPDITLSIVKNIPKTMPENFSRLYYVDEVYRLSRENQEYKVLNQIGVELIGPADNFSSVEIISLALDSLSLINDDYLLDVSHLGFISGVFDILNLSSSLRSRVMAEIRSKSIHNIKSILAENDVADEDVKLLQSLCEIQGAFKSVLPKLKSLADKLGLAEIQDAYNELAHIGSVAERLNFSSKINLDFSVVGDLDYYNGIVFAGYISGVPKEVLTGGRYDNLMKKMKKESCALGFGICLSLLNQYMKGDKTKAFDYDYLLVYENREDADYQAKLLSVVCGLNKIGKSVRLETSANLCGFSAEKTTALTAQNIDEILNTINERGGI